MPAFLKAPRVVPAKGHLLYNALAGSFGEEFLSLLTHIDMQDDLAISFPTRKIFDLCHINCMGHV